MAITVGIDVEFGARRYRASARRIATPALRRHDENQLLANLPATDLGRLAAHLELVRLPLGELLMTQRLVASMLGVRREGITEAAGRQGRRQNM